MTWIVNIWGRAKFYALAAAGAIAAVLVAYWRAREDGKNAIRVEQAKRRAEAMKHRKDIDDEVDQMGAADVDSNYARWLRDD